MTPVFSYPALRLGPLLAFSELVTSENTQAWTLIFCKQNLGSLGSCHSPGGSIASLNLGMVSLAESLWEQKWRVCLCGRESPRAHFPLVEPGPGQRCFSVLSSLIIHRCLEPAQIIDRCHPKDSFGRVFVCLFCIRVCIKELKRKEQGYSSSGLQVPGLQCPTQNSPVRVLCHVMPKYPAWEDEIFQRREEVSNGFATSLPMGLGGDH